MKTIEIKCRAADTLSLSDLTPFQGEMKVLKKREYEQLKKQIVERGFKFPFFVWPQNGTNHIEDGHQRHRVLGRMEKEGWTLPKFPVAYIDAETEEEARRDLFALNSVYGELTIEGITEQAQLAGLALDDVRDDFNLPNVHFPGDTIEWEECPTCHRKLKHRR